MTTSTARPRRALVVLICIVAAIVVVALVVVFSRGTPPLLDSTTPAGIVQRYSAAVISGDETAAKGYLSQSLRDGCDRAEFVVTDNIRVTLVATTERTESADVRVSITLSSENGPFGVSESSFEGVFDLVKENGAWRIDSAPGPLMICVNTGVTK
jgi:20S proteasome alpha/beta subunit